MRTKLYRDVIQKLLSRSYVEEGVTLTKHKEILTEVKLVETNEAFKFLQNCLNWIEAKQVKILNFDTKSIIFISVC